MLFTADGAGAATAASGVTNIVKERKQAAKTLAMLGEVRRFNSFIMFLRELCFSNILSEPPADRAARRRSTEGWL
jgi:hypothetical protein